jgi:hypothetical protein
MGDDIKEPDTPTKTAAEVLFKKSARQELKVRGAY